ncbi:dolichyl-phosphate beta-D-mannosyltransferase [Halorubrum ezzemoulense]|uniref:Dolichyl-phosphate beta-D-mannosyltransferase n=1 Tax=Halorubrum ezzemoulense TaxID=337243 RepID=A0A256IU73_HALEZ|nr:glycosyltransferase family 2 protein [Halorubrum ezzemoulense]OYR60110.1 dolichyl-phosphate beta-D-mannosyltransferase [Halorubrum ezzemoulense]
MAHASFSGGDNKKSVPSSSVYESNSPESIKILVGIPTYNEEVAIGSIVSEAQQYADEVVVVDDGSTDNTVQIARHVGATVIEHEMNKGKGGALRTLMGYAAEADDIDSLVILDGDGQHLPEDIPDVVDPVLAGECDISIGSRYIEETETETPVHRRFGQRVLDYLTMGSSGENLSDTQSGFRALSPAAISQLNLRTDGMGIESEMISEATDQDLEIDEVSIDVRYDGVDGQTFNPFAHGLSVAAFVTQLIRDRHPLLFFGVPALALLGVGGGLLLHTAFLYQTTAAFHQWRALISGFLVLTGVVCLFSALVLSQVKNMVAHIE